MPRRIHVGRGGIIIAEPPQDLGTQTLAPINGRSSNYMQPLPTPFPDLDILHTARCWRRIIWPMKFPCNLCNPVVIPLTWISRVRLGVGVWECLFPNPTPFERFLVWGRICSGLYSYQTMHHFNSNRGRDYLYSSMLKFNFKPVIIIIKSVSMNKS